MCIRDSVSLRHGTANATKAQKYEMGQMAGAVLGAVCERLRREGRLTAEIPSGATVERPPWASSGAPA